VDEKKKTAFKLAKQQKTTKTKNRILVSKETENNKTKKQ
jgi:hypothetical protein